MALPSSLTVSSTASPIFPSRQEQSILKPRPQFFLSPPSSAASLRSKNNSTSINSSRVIHNVSSRHNSPSSHPPSFSNLFSDVSSLSRLPVTSSSAPPMMSGSADSEVMSLLLRQRIVFLGAEINDFVADAIVSQLLLLDAQDPNKEIRLFINSPGGSTSGAMAIFDAIQLCRAPISTIAFGLAASTAAIILAGGSKGLRLAMPNARVMVHQPMGGASGQAIDVEIQAKEVAYQRDNVTRILAEVTGRSFEQVQKDIDRDRYMSPMEAADYGLLDGVIDKDTILPLLPSPERVKPKEVFLQANSDPRKLLIPEVPDSEIY